MPMLERIAGNRELKQDLKTALGSGRIAHSILLVGEPGCGAGFAARCLAADYLYPNGGPHAEAVLRGQDTESIVVRGEGASGQIKVEAIRDARQNIQKSALSSDAEGRVLFIYIAKYRVYIIDEAHMLSVGAVNALLKIMEEPPEGVMFLLTASSAAAVLPTIRSRCAAYTMAPVPTEECAAALRTAQPELNEQNAQDLAFLYEGHIGLCLKALTDPAAKVARAAARELCRQAQQQDTYRVQALLAGYEKDKDSAAAVLWQATQAASAALRRPGFDGVQPDTAARILRAAEAARRAMKANGNLRLALTVCGMEMAAR